jgi:hypothetical protein
MKVLCVRLTDARRAVVTASPWATVGRVYSVLSIWVDERGVQFRMVGDEPTPALFPQDMFEIVDPSIPATWIVHSPATGCFVFAPETWTRPGFWEDFFDGKSAAVSTFNEERDRILKMSKAS